MGRKRQQRQPCYCMIRQWSFNNHWADGKTLVNKAHRWGRRENLRSLCCWGALWNGLSLCDDIYSLDVLIKTCVKILRGPWRGFAASPLCVKDTTVLVYAYGGERTLTCLGLVGGCKPGFHVTSTLQRRSNYLVCALLSTFFLWPNLELRLGFSGGHWGRVLILTTLSMLHWAYPGHSRDMGD